MTFEEMYGLFFFLPVKNVGKAVFSGEHTKVHSLQEVITQIGAYGMKQKPGYRQCVIVVCSRQQMYAIWYDNGVHVAQKAYKQIVEIFRYDSIEISLIKTEDGKSIWRCIREHGGDMGVPGALSPKIVGSQLTGIDCCIIYKNEEGDFVAWEPGKYTCFEPEQVCFDFTESNDKDYPNYYAITEFCKELEECENCPSKVRFIPDEHGGYRFEIWEYAAMMAMRHMFETYVPLITGSAEKFDRGECLRSISQIRKNGCYWADRPLYASYDPCEWERDCWLQWDPINDGKEKPFS